MQVGATKIAKFLQKIFPGRQNKRGKRKNLQAPRKTCRFLHCENNAKTSEIHNPNVLLSACRTLKIIIDRQLCRSMSIRHCRLIYVFFSLSALHDIKVIIRVYIKERQYLIQHLPICNFDMKRKHQSS